MEPQYSGARIEGDVVTLDFVKKMMEDFKNQKTLHQRYVWEAQYFFYSVMKILLDSLLTSHVVNVVDMHSKLCYKRKNCCKRCLLLLI